MLYECHGLTWASELPLPELAHGSSVAAPDVEITLGLIEQPEEDVWRVGSAIAGDLDRFWLDVPGVARFLVEGGRRIVVEPAEGSHPDEVRLYLLGSALGAVLYQRGLLVLHGNAFRHGAAVVLAVGHSGAGKSTLAGELHLRGFDVFSDDVVAIDAEGFTVPGPPRVKLWQDAADLLGVSVDGLPRVRPQDDKFHMAIDAPPTQRLPVAAVYVLERHEEHDLELVHVAGTDRLGVLMTHTYRAALVDAPGQRRRHLQRCATLAARSRVVRVLRPAGSYRPAATADAILADISAHHGA
ncbi:hypothetical protein DSM112329_00810 [Paraconexibacter sp. AEG42_29]|uniref:HPr kinase/phosphorylase C-terminal domain-containing protein n=2 Tax=Paraconexibacter sp. AEG42_29 TaxID=2997339 RepID=A0AAU7AQL9_9ACTN